MLPNLCWVPTSLSVPHSCSTWPVNLHQFVLVTATHKLDPTDKYVDPLSFSPLIPLPLLVSLLAQCQYPTLTFHFTGTPAPDPTSSSSILAHALTSNLVNSEWDPVCQWFIHDVAPNAGSVKCHMCVYACECVILLCIARWLLHLLCFVEKIQTTCVMWKYPSAFRTILWKYSAYLNYMHNMHPVLQHVFRNVKFKRIEELIFMSRRWL